LYQLATNPDVLKKAQQQVDQVLGNNDPTYSNFEELTYLQWVVKETLRVNPVVTAIPRITTHQMEWKGFDIPKGTMIFTPFDSHSNPDFFPDPDEFQPERWDNLELKNRFAYTPFGYGNRACIGRKFATIEVVIILAMILQRYDVFVDKDYGEMEISSVITSKPKKDLYITFKPRIK
jgi:cytochrome P450